MPWPAIIIAFIGGSVGALIREFIILAVPKASYGFPVGIFVANVVASFLLGYAMAHHRRKNVTDEFILLVGTGVMGGMSTFSSFAYGALHEMITPGGLTISLAYIGASLIVGYIATWLGMKVAHDRRIT